MDKKLQNEKQVAKVLGVKVATLRDWRHKGQGPVFIKMGRSVRYHPADLQKFVSVNRRQSTKE